MAFDLVGVITTDYSLIKNGADMGHEFYST